MAQNTTAFNEAMCYNLAEAIDGEYPEQFIDFCKMKLSSGQLQALASVQATAASAESLTLRLCYETT